MDEVHHEHEGDPSFWAPGTITLEDLRQGRAKVILHPVPTSDPNDPLNWSKWRKTLNYAIVTFYVFMTFVELDIGFTAWEAYQTELGFTIDLLNDGAAINYAGLAVGCIFFVPLVHKYGRRPLYLFSTALQFGSVVWFAKTYTKGDLIGSNLISGLGGAISETIAQITIADLFFVHQHAQANGLYILATSAGAFLGPVASGYIVDSQGWRWQYWYCVIFFAVNLLVVVFFFEETKYVGALVGHSSHGTTTSVESDSVENTNTSAGHDAVGTPHKNGDVAKEDETSQSMNLTRSETIVDTSIPMKSYRQRLTFITPTNGSLLHDFYQPVTLLFTFPAITFCAITYGSQLAWFAVMTSVQATYLFSPPYNFTAAGVGLMNLAPFVGTIPGTLVGGWLNDKSIIWLAKRNKGVYEPEMRLWLALPAVLITPAGILLFGLGLNAGAAWPVVAVGYGLWGFAFAATGDIALSYVMDCYQDLIGNALVGIVFSRNVLSVIVLFTLTPWIDGMGLQNMHILMAVICFVILLLPIPLLIWGKKARIASASRYRAMALKQPTHRDL